MQWSGSSEGLFVFHPSPSQKLLLATYFKGLDSNCSSTLTVLLLVGEGFNLRSLVNTYVIENMIFSVICALFDIVLHNSYLFPLVINIFYITRREMKGLFSSHHKETFKWLNPIVMPLANHMYGPCSLLIRLEKKILGPWVIRYHVSITCM